MTARANGCCVQGRASNSKPCSFPSRAAARFVFPRQVGCTLNCRFCHTGTQKLVRNLTPGEIVGQLMIARDALGDWPSTGENRRITNVVMMGMGEPLYNFDNVKAALVDRDRRRRAGALQAPRHALDGGRRADDRARGRGDRLDRWRFRFMRCATKSATCIVPINKKYPIAELLAACRAYPGLSNARRITFEYVMLKGVNDSLADARELVRLMKGIPAKINLIPFNPWPGAPYECAEWEQIEKFAEIVNRAGYASPSAHRAAANHGRLRPAQKRKRQGTRERTDGGDAVGRTRPDAGVMASLFDLTGKIALVTGGSRGLGREMVLAFAKAGADVVIASRKLEACETVAHEVEALGRRALPIAAHVGQWNDNDVLAARAFDHFGRVDVLVEQCRHVAAWRRRSARPPKPCSTR